MMLEETSIELFNIKILEPVTTLTDLLVSVVCIYAFLKIQQKLSGEKIFVFFKYYFLLMAIATAYGGIIGHGFFYLFSIEWKFPGWVISMISVALIERAAIMHAYPLMKPNIRKFFSILNIVEVCTLISITLYTLNFFFVEAHAAYGLVVVVASFEVFVFLKTKNKGSGLLLIAVCISAIAATVHLCKFSIHKWFNYLDLSHVLMAMAAYVFYLGVKNIKTQKS